MSGSRFGAQHLYYAALAQHPIGQRPNAVG